MKHLLYEQQYMYIQSTPLEYWKRCFQLMELYIECIEDTCPNMVCIVRTCIQWLFLLSNWHVYSKQL